MNNFAEQWEVLPENLSNHLMITVIPLAIGIMISLPVAVFVVKHPRLRYPALTVVSVIQTIPSLALLALMVPILAGVSAVSAELAGVEISALGFFPAVVALTLYSMLPIVRNAVTGILEVDPAMTEAARGVGMTPGQVFWRVELPLAAPVLIAGIRTATVWVVGIATLATPVGQRCLGNYIFRGLQTRNWTAVLFGCVAAAVLAMLLDVLIGGVERAVKKRQRTLGWLCGIVLGLVFVGGIAAPAITHALVRPHSAMGAAPHERAVVIGTKTFTEQYILAALIADRLESAGFMTRTRESLGSTIAFDALRNGEIDCYVDYSGTIWSNHMNRSDPASAARVLQEMTDWLKREHGVHCLGSLGFENAYGLSVTREQASALRLRSIGDLAEHAPEMTIGGDYEFFGRPEWRSIRDTYGLAFAHRVSYDSTFMYTAVVQGDADVISAFTSDGRIAALHLVVLDDPKNAIPPYDAVLLLSNGAANRDGIQEALMPLIGTIDIETMRKANYLVDREDDKMSVHEAARWLANPTTTP